MKAEVADDADCGESAGDEASCEALDRMPELDAEVVRGAIVRLPPILRETVMLRYFEDKTLQEMAHLMKVPVGTVKSRLHLARRGLKRLLGRMFNGEAKRK